jgi:hypothetical protein
VGAILVTPILIVIAVIAVIGLIIWGAIVQNRRAEERRQAIAAYARSRGWSFIAGNNHNIPNVYGGFGQLNQGANRYAYNVINGTANDCTVTAFDYHYETYSTDNKGRRQTHHHHLTAMVLTTWLDFPTRLWVRPENFFDKVAAAFGADDIDFESHEFSKRFLVKSPDRKFAYDIIHQPMMEYLLTRPSISFEILGNSIYVQLSSGLLDAPNWPSLIDSATGIYERVPQYLADQIRRKSS